MDAAVISGIVLAAGVIIGGIAFLVRAIIRGAQYLAHSEAAQTRIADSNDAIRADLRQFVAEAERRFERIEGVQLAHGQEIAVLRDRTAAIRRQANGTA